MKKLLATVILILSFGASAFAWEDWSDYEMFCYANDIEPNYEEYEYYATHDGQCYPCENEEAELERIMNSN